MTWAMVILLAVAAFALIAFVLKAPRAGWEAVGSALLVGIAGFALQARPALPGAPKANAEQVHAPGEALVGARQKLSAQGPVSANYWIVVADGMSRNGQYADAAGVLRAAIEKDPNNADAWLALANNLVAHADGNLTPPALLAYDRAMRADPQAPGPRFFLGLALAQSGKLAEGRALWAELLAQSPPDAPWRKDLESRLARLDQFMAMQQGDGSQ